MSQEKNNENEKIIVNSSINKSVKTNRLNRTLINEGFLSEVVVPDFSNVISPSTIKAMSEATKYSKIYCENLFSYKNGLTSAIKPILANFDAVDRMVENIISNIPDVKFTMMPQIDTRWATIFDAMLPDLSNILPSILKDIDIIPEYAGDFFLDDCPENLKEIKSSKLIGYSQKLAIERGVSLLYIPNKKIVNKILRSKDTKETQTVLYEYRDEIVNDCSIIVNQAINTDYSFEAEILLEGISTLKSGNNKAAQATFTVVLDSTISIFYKNKDRKKITNYNKEKDIPDLIDRMDLLGYMLWAAILKAHESFWPDKGDNIPRIYNRHASVHAVSAEQYTDANCIQSLMLVTSLIAYGINTNKKVF